MAIAQEAENPVANDNNNAQLLQREGLSEPELARLKATKVESRMVGEACSICCDEFKSRSKVKKMPVCQHTFHPNCIDQWLRNKARCPNCNRVVNFAQDMQ